MKKFLVWITVIVIGIAVILLGSWSYQRYLLMSYRKSELRSLDFNPYTYEKRTKASVSYFYKSLPSDVRNFMRKKKMNIDDLTSCEADLIPGEFSEFVIGFFNGNKSNLLVIHTENQYKPKSIYDLSKLVPAQRKSAQEYFEIHCLISSRIFNNKSFLPSETEAHFVDQVRNINQDLLAIKLSTGTSLQIIAFNSEDKKFHILGKVASLQEPAEKVTPSKKMISSIFFSSLPQQIQEEINLKNPNHKNLTSCQGNVFPSRNSDYVVSYVADQQVRAFVFEVSPKGDLLATHDISSVIDSLKKGTDDDLEIQCRHGSYVLLNPDFKLKTSEKDLAIYFRNSNHEILQVKSAKSQVYSYLAYSGKDDSFHFIGTAEVP